MANNCIFCGNSAGSKEHIFPKWVLGRRDFGPFRLKRAGAEEVILNKVELTTKLVCHDCNTGWMSDLEGKVKPILEPMFEGKNVLLGPMEQFLISVWMVKMAFVWDSTKGRNADNAFFGPTGGEPFSKNYKIPDFTSVWIGHIDEEHRSADGADFTLDDGPNRIGGGSSMTLANEHFVGQVVSLRLNERPTSMTSLNIQPKPGDWDNMLINIWPPPLVQWPPKVSFTNGGPQGYAQRWRKFEYALTDLVAKARCQIPILALEVIDHDALAPLTKSGDDCTHTFARTAWRKEEYGFRS